MPNSKNILKYFILSVIIGIGVFITIFTYDLLVSGNIQQPVKCIHTALPGGCVGGSPPITSCTPTFNSSVECYTFPQSKFWDTPFFGRNITWNKWWKLPFFQKINDKWMFDTSEGGYSF